MKRIYIAVVGIFLLGSSLAQKIDRSTPPKGGPAPVISIADPVTFKLSNGITVFVVENHKLPRVSATYNVDYGPVKEGNKAGVLGLMGKMLNEGTTLRSKAAFDEAVDQMGADVDLNASGGSASSLTRYFDNAFNLMAEGLTKPAFPAESFQKLKGQALTGLKASEKSAKAISARVVSALNYGVSHPAGEFETEETINSITPEDVRKMYKQYISPSRGFLTFVGDITPAKARALAEKELGNWKGNTVTVVNPADVNNPGKTEIDIVDVPNAVQSEITVTNLVRIPMNSPDYFPVLLANNILVGNADARLFMNLREKHGFTYGSYSNIGTGRFQTTFNATASVRNEKADSSVMEILKEINNIRTTKVSDDELARAKALFAGGFALGLEEPARIASFASTIIINGLPKDFYKTYLQKINAVSAEDVQRVAQKYFNYNNTRVVVVGKAQTVYPGLSKLGYAINWYDKFAKPVAAPTASAPSSSAVAPVMSAKAIIDKFIAAIGGATELNKVKSIASTGEITVNSTPFEYSKKEMAPNMTRTEMKMKGQTMMKRVFTGTTGYQEQMGNKSDMSAEELKEMKQAKSLFPELMYSDGSYKLEVAGTEKVSGKDAFKVTITSDGSTSTAYYDVNTGYLVKKERALKMQGMDVKQSVEFNNYKKVGNIMLPFSNSITVETPQGSQELAIELKDIKLNEGVTADDFK
jgi:zinc protease